MPRPRRRGGWRRRFPWPGTKSTCRAETALRHRGWTVIGWTAASAQEMFRGEIDPPTRLGLAVRRSWPRRYRTTAARQARETEAGGVLAPDQVVGPAVLAEAQEDGGIGDAAAVVGDGDGETGFAGRSIGERGDGDPHLRGVGTTAVLQRLGHDIRKRAGVNPRDPPDGAVVDAGADRPGGRTGNLGHAWTSVRGVETETPRPA